MISLRKMCQLILTISDAGSFEETMDKIRKFVKEHPEKEIYYGRGFNTAFFPGIENVLGPKKERLDEICNTKPMVLTDFGGHTLWLNTKALELYNITRDTVAPSGGVIEKDPETGELWGTLKEYAKQLVPFQKFTAEENIQAVEHFQDLLHSLGYTSIFCLRPPGAIIPRETLFGTWATLEKDGRMKMRVNGARDMDPEGSIDEQVRELQDLKRTFESELIKVETAKFFTDGVVEGLTAFLMEPYGEAAGKGSDFCSEFIWDREILREAFQKFMKAGFQIHVHTMGDRSTKYCLDAMENAASKAVCRIRRNVFTHLQIVREEDILRMADMGVIANVQAFWHYKSPSMWKSLELPFLEERAETEYPLASFLRAGAVLSASADHPVTPNPNPFHAVQAGVTSNLYNSREHGLDPITDKDDPRWLLNARERVSVMDMLRAYTVGGAWQLFRENEIGTIEIGKFADFAIVDKDPFVQNLLELENIKVCQTIFNGECVYSVD